MDWDKAQTLLNTATRIIVLTHIAPDGDAIGSLLGLSHALRSIGKTVTPAVDLGMPSFLKFLPGSADVLDKLKNVEADLAIAVDCGDFLRVGEVGKAARALNIPMINLDHHRTNTLFGDANLVDPDTVAASEGILDWLDRLGISLTPDAAQCLLCGIVTDTLCFRTSNVTADTLGKAQRLVAAGANLTTVVQNTVNRIPTAAIKLWAQVMPTVQLEDNVIWAKISSEARKAAGFTDGTDGGLVSILIQAADAYVSCVMREQDNGSIELGFRAVPGFDVSKVAVNLGGGGHTLASGATVPGPLDEVAARVIPMLKEMVKAGTPAIS